MNIPLRWIGANAISTISQPLDERKIYYGLIIEESLGVMLDRGSDWLLDPLNPHAIAETRKDTYTRFTLLSLIRIVLQQADSEFTTDSPESVPLAGRLYKTALDLLATPELQQGTSDCDQIIGDLKNNC